jgi:hypothetical protein
VAAVSAMANKAQIESNFFIRFLAAAIAVHPSYMQAIGAVQG